MILASLLMSMIKSYQVQTNKPSLIWNLTDSRGLTFLPKIYLGYYGKAIDLIVYDSSKFVSDLILTSVSSPSFICSMGTTKCELGLAADLFNSVIKQYIFSHSSEFYLQPSLLEV